MKAARSLFVFVVAATFLLAACGGPAPAPEPAPVVEQPPVVEPTSPPPPTPEPVEPPPAEPAQPQYAPFCEAAPAGCEAPTVEMLDNKYCVNKVPYVIMSVPAGATYEPLDPDMKCVEQMHSDGSLRLTCSSIMDKQLISYDLKVCNGSCSAPALQMGTDQCPDGYGFDPASQCCSAPAPASGDGCTIFRVDIGACANN